MSDRSPNLYAGTDSLTTTAEGLGASTTAAGNVLREVLIQSDPANTVNVVIGDSASQTVIITPGQSVTIPAITIGRIYARAASGTATVNWIAVD